MLNVLRIPAFTDNYLWLIISDDNTHCAIVDPGDPAPILSELENHSLTLTDILITHHHHDHIGGIETLVQSTGAKVTAPANATIPHVSRTVTGSTTIILERLGCKFQTIQVPGHTRDHVAYYGHGALFCGDTLFAGGCGRLFEGSPEQMLSSLKILSALPADTLVYCAHEYTLANLNFALTVDPSNEQLLARLDDVKHLRQQGQATIPTTIGMELKTNPFLRCHTESVKASAESESKRPLDSEIEIFAVVRSLKDRY